MGIEVRSTKSGYRLMERLYKPHFHRRAIPRNSYSAHGFGPSMTFDEARERARVINATSANETKSINAAAKRVEDSKLVDARILPELLVRAFEKRLEDECSGNDDLLRKTLSRWSSAKKILLELGLEPKDFSENDSAFIAAFAKRGYAMYTVGKITRLINRWGSFSSKRTGSYFDPLTAKPKNRNQQRQILSAHAKVAGRKRTGKFFTEEMLKTAEGPMTINGRIEEWRWLYCAFWFGLRPKELSSLIEPNEGHLWRVEFDSEKECDVLWVFQTKTGDVELDDEDKKRHWKPIAVHFAEQKQALKWIRSGSIKRPHVKVVQQFLGVGFYLNSPRKGTTDLFRSRGYSFDDASIQLGHKNLATTMKHYKDPHRFNLPIREARHPST